MSDFSDRPFVAGSLIGLRAFKPDELGRLHGPSFGGVFKPGENVAECSQSGRSMRRFQRDLAEAVRALEGKPGNPQIKGPRASDHTVAGVDCSCGFYAYFDGGNDYARSGTVSALVEGYGVCTVGHRGFRAEKARLVALVLPKDKSSKRHSGWFDRLADRLYMNGVGALVGVPSGLSGLAAVVLGPSLAFSDSPWFALLAPLGLALMVLAVVVFKADFHAISRHYPSVSDVSKCYDHGAKKDTDQGLIRRNYPDVPTYPTVAAAIKAHPLTPPPAPTPDDGDFWIRPVTR